MARRVPERFLVAFSLAGEQRELVRAVAEEVELRLGESTVFYDEWYEFYIAGGGADLKLQKIYREQCELAVICISDAYGQKPWTLAEHEAVRARYLEAATSGPDRDRVLPVRVGDGEVDGIHLNYIVPDIRTKSCGDAAQLIIDRLQYVSPASMKSEPEKFEWLQLLPAFRWPLADHTEAQAAFCDLLMRTSTAKLLFIKGASETGKSSLARQMERNVAELLPELRCGRFDFKGNADRGIEVEAFAQSLGLALPGSRSETDQLSGVMGQLLHLPRTTLLIFDTYEDAGDEQAWMKRIFLRQLLQLDWLRVVILGQQVPAVHGEVWESIAAQTIQLEIPDAQAWFEYARLSRPDDRFDLDFVVTAHQMSNGKPATLASLLGPR